MKILHFKDLIIVLLIILAFTFCQDKVKKIQITNTTNLDSLFAYSYDLNKSKSERLKYIDTIEKILKVNINDIASRSNYLKLAIRYNDVDETLKYLNISHKVLKFSQRAKDSLNIIKSSKNIGNYYYSHFKNDSAYYYFTQSEKINNKLKNKLDLSNINIFKSNILLYEKDFAGCETSVIKVLKVALIKKDNRLIYDCYITLGNALDGLNNFEKSLEYYNKAFKITNKLRTDIQYSALKAQNLSFIGNLYKKSGQYSTAASYYQKALKFDDFKKNDKYIYSNLINNLAYSKFKLGDKSAINQLNEAYQIRDSLKNIPGIVSSKINLSEYYLYQKDTIKALTFSIEAKVLAHKNNIFEDELKSLEFLAKIDPKNNQVYNKRFIKLTDSLQNNERATRNKFARIEFETDEILNEKNTIEVEKDKISSQRWLILGSSLLVLIIGGLLYFTKMQHSRNKVLEFEKKQQKANESIYQLMLDQQSKIDEGRNVEKKRISQELHDGIIGKLASVRMNLFVLSRKNDDETIKNCLVHVEKIKGIENEIQAISRDLAKDIFLSKDSFNIIIEELFKNQVFVSNLDYTLYIDEKINWENVASTTKMHLYRIFQESLQNIFKYAEAKNINAKISKVDNQIEIEIADDGKGFDVSKSKDGIGLKNMKSRSDLINGELKIVSNKDKGTEICLILPI